MKFTVALAMCEPGEILELAKGAEALGWDGIALPDSVFYPQTVSAGYPYTPDGSRFWDEDTPFVDPIVGLAAAAGATERVRCLTNVVKMVLRHPLLVAKQIGSFEAMFPGRLALGVGLSWIPEEFEWLGVPQGRRGKRLDESIEILRAACSPGWTEFDGDEFQHGPLRMSPIPNRCPPVLIGGHSEPAMRRAARIGDGWVSAMVGIREARDHIETLRRFMDESGRDPAGFEFVLTPMVGPRVSYFEELAAIGTTEVVCQPWYFYGAAEGTSAKLAAMERFAADVIEPLGEHQ